MSENKDLILGVVVVALVEVLRILSFCLYFYLLS